MEDLLQILEWKRLTKKRFDILLDLHAKYISKEEAEYYKNCDCPSAFRIMYLDLKKYIHDKITK